MSRSSSPLSPRFLALLLAVALAACGVASMSLGPAGSLGWSATARALGALCWGGQPLDPTLQIIVENRLWRTLTAMGVGAGLSLSGGLLQGLFRNGLASPSLIGITPGAVLGASLAILALGGYGPDLQMDQQLTLAPLFVSAASLVGALGVAFLVTAVASSRGEVSVPTLLLTGIAINACAAGLIQAIQSLALDDFEITRAIFAWTFGNLDDRSSAHVWTVGVGLALAVSAIPFVARELDLFAGGEEQALSLGVAVGRVKWLALVAASLAAATAVSVAGQIAFIGLVVPHLLRLLTGSSHRTLLPLCLLGGALFLLGADVLQRALIPNAALQPGVVMSIIGGPFFLFLLVRSRRGERVW